MENGSLAEQVAVNADEHGSSGAPSSRSSQRVRTPISSRSASDDAVPTRRLYGSDDAWKSKSSAQITKKKKGGMLGFLTLKEPSTSAWAQFADAEKEKARQKGVNTSKSGLPGVSSQKLPEFVPKVNSKWDGLPESVHRKSSDSKTTNRTNRTSTVSSSTRQSNWTAMSSMSEGSQEAKHRFGCISSPLQSPRHPRDSTGSNALYVLDERKSTSSSSTRQPPALAIETASREDVVETTDENRPQTFLLEPSPVEQEKIALPQLTVPLTPPELDGAEMPLVQELDAKTNSGNGMLVSPLTPPAEGNNNAPALMGIHYPELDSASGERGGAESMLSGHDPTPERNIDSLAPPSPPFRRNLNFSRPRREKPDLPRLQALPPPNIAAAIRSGNAGDGVTLSPSLKTSTGRIEPFLTDTFATHSRETGHIPQRVASTSYTEFSQVKAGAAEESSSFIFEDTPPPEDMERPTPLTFYDDQDRPETAGSDTTAHRDNEPSAVRSNSQASLAPSHAPSAMSERWQMSPKERLGLGSRVRRSEVMPWELAEDLDAMRDVSGPTSPLPESKRKRLSIRLSTKK